MIHTRVIYLLTILLFPGISQLPATAQIAGKGKINGKPYNVLFICVDDLRPDLGCYGNQLIHTPNMDKLAAGGTLFRNHFVTVPTCGASRASLLTGMLPRAEAELRNDAMEYKKKHRRPDRPESFIHLLKQNGYHTTGIGKISHSADGYVYGYTEPRSDVRELPESWDDILFNPGKWKTGWNSFFAYADGSDRNTREGAVKPYENVGTADEDYPDGLTALLAVEQLQKLKDAGKPFFLGVGFFKPHLPFNAPKKYWDLYDEKKLPLTPSPDIPANVNLASLHPSAEFNSYKQGEEKPSLAKPVSDAYARRLRHAYYAAVSYTDAQIGKVLNELQRTGLDKNTIVVLWGDHGWHLGDDRVWGKHTLAEWSLRSPLLIRAPGVTKGEVTDKTVSTVDIYPTLMELCGVDIDVPADGRSLVPLLRDPEGDWQSVAYSYFRKGVTLRTERYRLTRYFRKEQPVTELYDHLADPFANTNIAASHPSVVNSLMPLWEQGDTGVYRKEKPETGATSSATAGADSLLQHTYTYKVAAGDSLQLDVFTPARMRGKDRPVVIFFHGGGWVRGDRSQFHPQCRYFAERGLVAVTASYRFMKRGDAIRSKNICLWDAKSAIRWVRQHAGMLGIDSSRVILGGGSAGGHLATMAALNPGINDPADHTEISTRAAALLLFNPGYQEQDPPGLLPYTFVSGDTCPVIMFFGDADSKWMPPANKLYKLLKQEGVKAEMWTAAGQKHGFFNQPDWNAATCAQADSFLISVGLLNGTPKSPPPGTRLQLR